MDSGGQEYRTMAEVAWLNANGHEAWIACSPNSWIFQNGTAAKLPMLSLDMPSTRSLAAMWKLYHIVREFHCDVVHVHGSSGAWTAAPLRLLGTPVVRSRHITNRLRRGFFRTFSYRYACNHLIPTAEFTRQRFLNETGIPADHMTVVGEGVDLACFNRNVDGCSFRLLWGAKPQDIIFGCVAMLRMQKGQKILIEAAEHVLKKVPNARFVFVGDNTDPARRTDPAGSEIRTRYRKLVREKFGYDAWRARNPISLSENTPLLMHGHEPDVARATAAFDVVVIPSLEEAQSRTAPEALCLGKPIIASRVGGLPEVVEHEKTGLLVPPKDVESLAEAMIRLASDRNLREKLAVAAADAGEQRFSLDARMLETLRIYEKFVKRNRCLHSLQRTEDCG